MTKQNRNYFSLNQAFTKDLTFANFGQTGTKKAVI